MKKLMTLLGVMAFALGAFALPSGTSFEGEEAMGAFALDAGDPDGANPLERYWVSEEDNLEAYVTNSWKEATPYSGVNRPAQFAGNANNGSFLAIESATKPLYRTVKNVSGQSLKSEATLAESDVQQAIGDGLYVDTLVQFTVSDSEGAGKDFEINDGVKLAVWVESAGEDQPTNFVVRAGYMEGETLVATNYVMTTPEGFDGDWSGWHRLTLKAIADIGTGSAGFVIFVDGMKLVRSDPSSVGDITFNNKVDSQFEGAVLPSLLDSDEITKNSLAAVGFSGTGNVDDISFTETAPDFARDSTVYTVTWDETVTGVTYGETALVSGAENQIPGASFQLVVTYANGYEPGTPAVQDCVVTKTSANESEVTYTVANATAGATIAFAGFVPKATVVVGNETFSFATLGEAFAKAKVAGGTITLSDDVVLGNQEGYMPEGLNVTVVIDLAGHTITGGNNVFVVAGGTLAFTNSTVAVGTVLADENKNAVKLVGGGDVDIYGGKFDGAIEFDAEDGAMADYLTIYGGMFRSADWNNELKACLADSGIYVSEPEDGFVTVGGEAPAATFVIRIVKTEGEPVEYDTLPEAIAAYEAGDVIEFGEGFEGLTGNAAKVFNKAGRFVFKYDVNAMATYMSLAGTGDFTASQPQTDDEENPTIVYYDVTENLWVASVNGTKYATFAAAYSAAPSEGAALVVKVGSEGFTPTFPDGSGNEVAKTFASIEFINTDDAEISIATKAGNKALTAATWISPAKATLTLGASQTVTSITAATLILPANVTLTLASGTVFGPSGSPTVSTLSGAGTVYLTGAFPGNSLLSLVQKSAWTGVLSLYNVQGGDSKIALSQYGNANSTVRFNYVLCGVYPEFSNFSGTLELDGWGWYLKGSDYASGASILISAALKGSGALTIEAAGTGKQDVKLTGDISQYTGHISFGSTSTARVCFGASHSAGAAASRCIIVPAGKDMQLPAGAKLTAPTGFVIQGGLDALGTLAVEGNESIYGSGVVKTHGVANAVKAAGTWTGTYRIAGGASGALVLSKFGSNANSTIEIVEDIDGAYPATADSHAPSIISTLKLSADWTVSDGWSDVNEVTTFAKLTGEGNLTVNGKSGGNAGDIYYTITRLEGYSGTLGGARGRFKVGTIVAAVEPTAGTKLVKLASGTREFLDLDSTVVMYNNAVVENITLEQKSDGIYVASPAIDPDQGTTVDVDTTASEEDQRAEAQTKANAMDVAKTADASAVDQATWNGYFTKTVEKVDDKWVATAALNPAAVLPVDDTVEEAKLTDMLESVTAAALDDKTPTAVPTKAGLYYWIAGATEVGATTYTPGTAALGDGTKKALTMPTLDDEDGKAFYKVCVGVEAPVAE